MRARRRNAGAARATQKSGAPRRRSFFRARVRFCSRHSRLARSLGSLSITCTVGSTAAASTSRWSRSKASVVLRACGSRGGWTDPGPRVHARVPCCAWWARRRARLAARLIAVDEELVGGARDLNAVERDEPLDHVARERRAREVDAQVHLGRHIVHILPSRPAGACVRDADGVPRDEERRRSGTSPRMRSYPSAGRCAQRRPPCACRGAAGAHAEHLGRTRRVSTWHAPRARERLHATWRNRHAQIRARALRRI